MRFLRPRPLTRFHRRHEKSQPSPTHRGTDSQPAGPVVVPGSWLVGWLAQSGRAGVSQSVGRPASRPAGLWAFPGRAKVKIGAGFCRPGLPSHPNPLIRPFFSPTSCQAGVLDQSSLTDRIVHPSIRSPRPVRLHLRPGRADLALSGGAPAAATRAGGDRREAEGGRRRAAAGAVS